MASLKDEIITSFVPGMAIRSADLQAIQNEIPDLWADKIHWALHVDDDFTTANLAAMAGLSSFTDAVFTDGNASDHFAVIDDSAAGANGAVKFDYTRSGSDHAGTLSTVQTLALGQSDLYLTTRFRVPSIGGTNSDVLIGLSPLLAGGPNMLAVTLDPTINGNSHLFLWYGSASSPTKVDLGVGAGTSAHKIVDIRRVSGVISVIIDGVPITTVSPSPFNLDAVFPVISASAETSGTTTAIFDGYRLWARTSR